MSNISNTANYFDILEKVKRKTIDYAIVEGSDALSFRFKDGSLLKIEFEAEAVCIECYGEIKNQKTTLTLEEGTNLSMTGYYASE